MIDVSGLPDDLRSSLARLIEIFSIRYGILFMPFNYYELHSILKHDGERALNAWIDCIASASSRKEATLIFVENLQIQQFEDDPSEEDTMRHSIVSALISVGQRPNIHLVLTTTSPLQEKQLDPSLATHLIGRSASIVKFGESFIYKLLRSLTLRFEITDEETLKLAARKLALADTAEVLKSVNRLLCLVE
jgi:hypothetical protein